MLHRKSTDRLFRGAGGAEARILVLLAFAVWPSCVQAQSGNFPRTTQARSTSAPRTSVSVELLADRFASGVNSQRWGAVFRQCGVTIRIRQPLLDDRPLVTEQKRGRLRLVKAVGKLKSDGSIQFPDRAFRLGDTARLREWITELTVYGAQGSTEGKPGFGLSRSQFEVVFRTLGEPVTGKFEDVAFDEALRQIALPRVLPMRLARDSEILLTKNPPQGTSPTELSGLSRGTVLAIVLNNAGLGFHPGRTPAGTLEIVVSPIRDDAARWPVGWPLTRAPLHIAPGIVQIVPVELDDVALPDVLAAVSSATDTPILVDEWRIGKAGIDLEKLRVTQPLKKMTWSGFLDRVTFPKLMREILVDEHGTPFVWITTRTVKQMNERAKQRDARFANKKK